jgi:arsenite methyltransferase
LGGCLAETEEKEREVSAGAAVNDRQKADYGIDAPGVVRNLAVGGGASISLGLLLYFALRSRCPSLAVILLNVGLWSGTFCLLTSGAMVWSSKAGKLCARDRLLDSIPWRGDEMVLDVGCGRGLMLIGAAKRLTTGRAIGLDVWQSEDQSGNHPEVTRANARAEGVANRVEVMDGDARRLPFNDDEFDVVLSSLALHNIRAAEERKQAVREISRVLKAGGHVAILDIWRTNEYKRVLRESGMRKVIRSGPRFFIYPPVRVVSGTSPIARNSAE